MKNIVKDTGTIDIPRLYNNPPPWASGSVGLWQDTNNCISPISSIISVDTPALTVQGVPVATIYTPPNIKRLTEIQVGDNLRGAILTFRNGTLTSTNGNHFLATLADGVATSANSTGELESYDDDTTPTLTFTPINGPSVQLTAGFTWAFQTWTFPNDQDYIVYGINGYHGPAPIPPQPPTVPMGL
jgi:hypothetical protein